jgi:CspA family cold shock protein
MHRPKRPDDLAREAAGAPPEPLGTRATTVGTVKFWRDEKGYGAIASDATAPWDIWCHFSHIDMPGFRLLEVGERVDVEYIRTDQESFRYRALRVRRPGASSPIDEYPTLAGE